MAIDSNEKQLKKSKLLIADYLDHLIKKDNLSIEKLARESGMSKRIIYNILSGKGYTMDSLLKLIHSLQPKEEGGQQIIALIQNITKN